MNSVIYNLVILDLTMLFVCVQAYLYRRMFPRQGSWEQYDRRKTHKPITTIKLQ